MKSVRYLCWTSGSVHGDDALYAGVIEDGTRSSEHSLEQINQALAQVPAERVFPPLPFPWYHTRTRVTVADDWDEEPSSDLYLKRPWMNQFFPDARPGDNQVAVWFAHEVQQLERLALSPPHPNLLRYHGCRVRNGRVTGILLDRLPGQDLCAHLNSGGTIDKEPFFAALASAIDHLHNIVGLVHNDINPSNVMVGPDGAPTLIDLGAAFPEGEEMALGVPYAASLLFPPLPVSEVEDGADKTAQGSSAGGTIPWTWTLRRIMSVLKTAFRCREDPEISRP